MGVLRFSLLGGLGLVGLALFGSACSDAESAGGGQYAEKCELVCAPPSGPCGMEDPAACQTSCTTALDGLSVECAQCVVENSGWAGSTCSCSNGNCTSASFGPGDNQGGSGPDICDPAKSNRCSGFELAKTSGDDCQAVCAPVP